MHDTDFDVAVVGASIAGCTAAILFARAGARVALIESHGDPAAYKHSCTHMIQSSANGVLDKLGIADALEQAGAVRTAVDTWTEMGWIQDPGGHAAGENLCVRRSTLDPLLRERARDTAGVELILGARVTALLTDGGTAIGLEATHTDGSAIQLLAPLTVGADGRGSTLAELAQMPTRVALNARGVYFAYYTDLPLADGTRSQVWLHGTDVAYAFPTDGGLTLLAAFTSHERLDRFKADRENELTGFFAELPRAPEPRTASRIGPVQGRVDIDSIVRPAAVAGLALVGDAAIASDPVVGVGCGWAFQTADWLVDETAAAATARDAAALDDALKRYRARHHAELNPHQVVIAEGSKALPPSNQERTLLSAASKDTALARRFHAYSSRNITPKEFLGPKTMMRAAWVDGTRRKRKRAA
jgi:2-polyprenyl-6-methoxyphenol hydroxylase-like FAD-dependent oxidoreductase